MWEGTKNFIEKHKYKIAAGLGLLGLGYYFVHTITDQTKIKMSHFITAIKAGYIEEAKIVGDTTFFRSSSSGWYSSFAGNLSDDYIIGLLQEQKALFSVQDPSENLLNTAMLIGSSLGTMNFLAKEIQKVQISNTKIQSSIVKNNQKFEDFYGGQLIKVKLKEIIDFLKNPQKYEKMGARIRRGVLLYGPPGTGKTLLARALANQANCEFIKVVASEFQELFVGVGPKRVRQLFKAARACPNGCIIFVDEIDALGTRLNHLKDSHQTTSTINQFLSQLDGFSPLDKVVIVAATNRIDLVDYAILRAGRFDIKVHIQLPGFQERKGIFKKILDTKCKKYSISNELIQEVGYKSEEWCGADLQNLINQSIYKAIKQKADTLQQRHVLQALKELSPKNE